MENKESAASAQFGCHMTLDGYAGDASLLQSKDVLLTLLKRLPEKLGMHVILGPEVVEVGPNNKKDPGGISGFVMIAESHISIHTFPKRGFVSADVYTCQNDLNRRLIEREFKTRYKLKNMEVNVIPRGTKYPVENIYR